MNHKIWGLLLYFLLCELLCNILSHHFPPEKVPQYLYLLQKNINVLIVLFIIFNYPFFLKSKVTLNRQWKFVELVFPIEWLWKYMRLAHVDYNKYISSIFNISLDILGWEKRMGLGLYSIVIEYKVSKGICLKSILSFRKFQRIKKLRLRGALADMSYILSIIFPSQPDIFLLRNYPFQAFLVSKTYISHMKKQKKLTFLFICPLRHRGGGKGLSVHVRQEWKFFLLLPLYSQFNNSLLFSSVCKVYAFTALERGIKLWNWLYSMYTSYDESSVRLCYTYILQNKKNFHC